MNMITRVCASLQARYIIPYQQAHFDKTKYGKRLTTYKGKYAGNRCFLIENGPSLRAEDLKKLCRYSTSNDGRYCRMCINML